VGVPKVFKVHYSRIEDRRGHAISLIGKLVDVSKDVKEKEELLTRAQLDGLTNYTMPQLPKPLLQNAF